MSPVFDHPQTSYKWSAVKVQARAKGEMGTFPFEYLALAPDGSCPSSKLVFEEARVWLALYPWSAVSQSQQKNWREKTSWLESPQSFVKEFGILLLLKLISADTGCLEYMCEFFPAWRNADSWWLVTVHFPAHSIVLHANFFFKNISVLQQLSG